MRDAFDGIGNAMRVVVHRVDAPFVAGVVVMGAADAVDDGVAHIDVARSHIDFQAQGFTAVWKLAVFHAREQVEVFFDTAVAVRAVFARFGQRTAVFTHFFRCQIIDIRFAVFD